MWAGVIVLSAFLVPSWCDAQQSYGQQGSSDGSNDQSYNSQRYDNPSIQARSNGSNYSYSEDNNSQSSYRSGRGNQSDDNRTYSGQSSGNQQSRGQSSSNRGSRSSASDNNQSDNSSSRSNQSQSSGNWSGNQSGSSDENTARDFIREHDRNNDGVLSRNELPSGMRSNFDTIDRNGDGYLSSSELRRHAGQMASSGGPAEVMYVWINGANRGQPSLQDLQQAYDMLQKNRPRQ